MAFNLKLLVPIVFCVIVSSYGCKRKDDTPQPATIPAASASSVKAIDSNATAGVKKNGVFDINSVPVSNIALPPFPYLDWPQGLVEGARFTDKSNFDRAYVIAGNQLHAVEGRIESRRFSNADAQLSSLASQRNYETAIEALGGVKVNTVSPDNPDLVKENGGDSGDLIVNKLRLKEYLNVYDAYLIRTPEKNVWIVLVTSSTATQILTIEEQEMKQVVAFVTADTMQTELNTKGHIALYINFDTDKAVIKQDGLSTVDEIVKLLNKDPVLKLSIEGHTDNSGNGQHNKTLSQERANAVVMTLVSKGIDKGRLSASGLGADNPIADNGNEEGRAKNRRVELVKL